MCWVWNVPSHWARISKRRKFCWMESAQGIRDWSWSSIKCICSPIFYIICDPPHLIEQKPKTIMQQDIPVSIKLKHRTKLLRYCGGKTRHVIWKLSFVRESRNCVVVRSRGADRVCGFSVDHRNFTRIDVDESFKCRTEYRILKYEHVKKYTFKATENWLYHA